MRTIPDLCDMQHDAAGNLPLQLYDMAQEWLSLHIL